MRDSGGNARTEPPPDISPFFRHARTCSGHPRPDPPPRASLPGRTAIGRETWMPGTSPGMTTGVGDAYGSHGPRSVSRSGVCRRHRHRVDKSLPGRHSRPAMPGGNVDLCATRARRSTFPSANADRAHARRGVGMSRPAVEMLEANRRLCLRNNRLRLNRECGAARDVSSESCPDLFRPHPRRPEWRRPPPPR